jgi:hypothetical protein
MLNSKEKKEFITKLLKEDKTYKEISKEAHASFSEISKVNKELQGDDSESASTRNQAYKMYLSGKKPIDVAIELQIDNVETTRYWEEYLELTKDYKLLKMRNELKDDFLTFVALYKVMKNKRHTLDEIKRALELAEDIDKEGLYLEYLKNGVSKTQEQWDVVSKEKKELESELCSLKEQKNLLEGGKQVLLVEIASLINHKDFIKQVYYSPVSRVPITRHGLSS